MIRSSLFPARLALLEQDRLHVSKRRTGHSSDPSYSPCQTHLLQRGLHNSSEVSLERIVALVLRLSSHSLAQDLEAHARLACFLPLHPWTTRCPPRPTPPPTPQRQVAFRGSWAVPDSQLAPNLCASSDAEQPTRTAGPVPSSSLYHARIESAIDNKSL